MIRISIVLRELIWQYFKSQSSCAVRHYCKTPMKFMSYNRNNGKKSTADIEERWLLNTANVAGETAVREALKNTLLQLYKIGPLGILLQVSQMQ